MNKFMTVTTKSPGGHCYRFQMKDVDKNRKMLISAEQDPIKMKCLLDGMRSKGLMPMQIASTAKSSAKTKTIQARKQNLSTDGITEAKAPLAGTITAMSDLEIASQSLASVTEKKATKKSPSTLRVDDLYKDKLLVHTVERRILEEVMKRPPLYDFTMDLKYRTPHLKFSLFLEIGQILTDEMYIDLPTNVIENTWTHYKGLHTQFNNLSKVPSGSGGGRTPAPFLHMDILRELDSVTAKRDQFSSLSGQRFDLVPPKSRKTKGDEIGPLIKGASQLIADLNKSAYKEETITSKRASGLMDTDPDHNYFLGLLPDLKKLKPRDQRAVKFEFANAIKECLDRYEDEGSNY